MDPIANLKEQLEIAKRIQDRSEIDGGYVDLLLDQATDAERIAELVLALDTWLKIGGFSPWSVAG